MSDHPPVIIKRDIPARERLIFALDVPTWSAPVC